ncbi:hypothetical protein SAMN05444392_1095 [Seinonella peptonophila]|uniref:Uncharacterized protein n=1 Tax=Seinonella peptonophila TaxID=112248 RepID=A0A1M4ZE25_9BACL|nr:hypothetical protein [Seinonella peptonophila]SHF16309.1 hypothetical protein SAMN05444392_1095 [Seinonella peptonophila]
MDQQKKQLIGIILQMLKDIYYTTSQLEQLFQSHNIHILKRNFDPFQDMLMALGLSDEKGDQIIQLIKLYVEESMTLEEVLVETEDIIRKETGALN